MRYLGFSSIGPQLRGKFITRPSGRVKASGMGQPGAILGLKDKDSNLIALPVKIPPLLCSYQSNRAGEFHLPGGHSAVVILRIHPKAGVRIHPLSLRDDTSDRNRFADVIHRGNRVMYRQHRRKRENCSDQSDAHDQSQPLGRFTTRPSGKVIERAQPVSDPSFARQRITPS